jgi:peptide/nickel transport system permease protein
VLLGLLLVRYGFAELVPKSFDPSQPVEFALRVGQFALGPWLLALLARRGAWEHSGLGRAARVGVAALQFVVIAAAFQLAWTGPSWRPTARYNTREFAREEFLSKKEGQGDKRGVYALIPYGPSRQDLSQIFQPPYFDQRWKPKPESEWKDVADRFPHLLGTDDVGRDVLVRMMYGTRVSITIGFVAVSIYLTIGCFVGAVAGYFGGWIDILANRVIEVVLLFPAFFLILTLVGMLGPNIYIIMVVIGLTGWPTVARLIRGEVLKHRSADYVTAARALGLSNTRIIFQHILPNALAPALVAAPFGIANAIITEASLSLLGFGVQPPAPTWGVLLKLANQKYEYWWLVMVPTVAIFFSVSVFNLIGSGLRDAMDPRLRATR